MTTETITSSPETLPTACPDCDRHREHLACADCGHEADVIDCGHYQQPAEIAGSAISVQTRGMMMGEPVCEDCETRREELRRIEFLVADLDFRTPPVNQGQIVEVSYAIDGDSDLVYRRRRDRSAGETTYQVADLEDLPGDEEFEPWQAVPAIPKDAWRAA